MVLGAIIEKISGMSYADFMKQNVFAPASMVHTHVYSKAVYDKIPVDVVGHDRGQWRYSVAQNFQTSSSPEQGSITLAIIYGSFAFSNSSFINTTHFCISES